MLRAYNPPPRLRRPYIRYGPAGPAYAGATSSGRARSRSSATIGSSP